MQLRTQIYLEPSQHAALLKEARRLGISLAGLVRKLVDEHVLGRGARGPSAAERKRAALSLIGLGRSGFSDVSENVDKYVGQAIHEEIVRERPVRYRSRKRKRSP